MAQGQNKPVRSREMIARQLVACDDGIIALSILLEAEARGAAEQRRKDAEGQEPVAWRYEVKRMGYWVSREVGYGPRVWEWYWDGKRPDPTDPDYRNVSPLYERPTNVAALEARIAELEDQERKDAQVIHWLAEKLKHADPEAKADYELLARAALPRDGEV